MAVRGLLVSVSVLALTSAALAADLSAPYTKAPPMQAYPVWAGWYLGVQGGVAHNQSSFNDFQDWWIDGNTHEISKTGGAFGGNVGYNFQSGDFIWGLESDINWVGAKADRTFFGDTFLTSDITWMGSFRGRVGFDYASTLFYATGGLAYGGVKNSVTYSFTNAALVEDKTKAGWTIGAGVEHLFSNHLTLRAEARFTDLGKSTPTGTGGYRGEFSNQLWTGMVGLGYKF